MNVQEIGDCQSSVLPDLPKDSQLEFEVCGAAQTVIANGEGLAFQTCKGLILGCLFVVPAISLAYFSSSSFLVGEVEAQASLLGLGVSALLMFYGCYAAKPSFQASWCKIKMHISDGILHVEHQGPAAEEPMRIPLAKVIETGIAPTYGSSRTGSLWVRMPTYDLPVLNKFLQNKDMRKHDLVSYSSFIVRDRRLQELQFLAKWLNLNISEIKAQPNSSF